MVVVGFTYRIEHDPPECYVAVFLEDTVIRSVLLMQTVVVPFAHAEEITDKKTIKAISVLYDG